jgi:metallophosphoesterase superfamily enzyme
VSVAGAAAPECALASGVLGVWPGLGWLPESRTLVVADAHFGYEDVIGAALPLWSTAEQLAKLRAAVRARAARELVFLGDAVHGPNMSAGAAQVVREALAELRELVRVTLVAGNHEGRSRAFSVLGETERVLERDGWLLVHGDGPPALGRRALIGHYHPSLRLGRRATAPAFVASEKLIVLPALTPYSPGLDLCSEDFATALGRWDVRCADAQAVVVGERLLYPFGSLAALRALARDGGP